MAEPLYVEKPGTFYLGKAYDLDAGKTNGSLLRYDAKDLTTHGVCVGMTGSGKTGLCLALLEEAALNGIPAICIDPKGDLGNLLLAFPQLRPADFRPWVDPSEATRRGMSLDDFAAQTATQWKEGLAQWGQDGARIQRFKDAADVAIYTPGSNAGLPLSVLQSFAAPDEAIRNNPEALGDRIASSVSGLLALLGIDADPLRSPEHILLSNLLDHAWRAGRNLDMATLIREIPQPPFDKVGVMDIESFYPAKERFALSMSLNNLLAAPGFSAWMQGEPLDIQRMLYTATGKPRLAIISIAHLSDAERMFFVTLLLGEMIAWMRAQSGTSSLRALLYMDEVFGYFPPTANPPSKVPMLTLLKQARAFGLGVLLATQNPVDLDYKGLSNAGTWFLGRLQTERDKMRVLDGLEGASAAAGTRFDRSRMEKILSGLGKRVFVLNNVHEDEPAVMQSRWALSFLCGPLTRDQISQLMAERKSAASTKAAPEAEREAVVAPTIAAGKPILPPGLKQVFLKRESEAGGSTLRYRPALYGTANVHFVDTAEKFSAWQPHAFVLPLDGEAAVQNWNGCDVVVGELPGVLSEPDCASAQFDELPSQFRQPKALTPMRGELKDYIYQSLKLEVRKCAMLNLISQPGQSDEDFRHAIVREATSQSAAEISRLETALDEKIRPLEEAKLLAPSAAWLACKRAMASIGNFLLRIVTLLPEILMRVADMYFNKGRRYRKVITQRQLERVGSAWSRSGREANREPGERTRGEIEAEIARLHGQFEADKQAVEARYDHEQLFRLIEKDSIPPRKSDIDINELQILWRPREN
jgi:hypothetical protein